MQYPSNPYTNSIMNELKNIHHVNFTHSNGPLIVFRNGSVYWMNYRERIMVALGFKNRVLKKIDNSNKG
jgi:hypothetical protein